MYILTRFQFQFPSRVAPQNSFYLLLPVAEVPAAVVARVLDVHVSGAEVFAQRGVRAERLLAHHALRASTCNATHLTIQV